MDKFGKIVNQAREKKGHTLKAMARALRVSEGFARHVETTKHVAISERVAEALQRVYRLPSSVFDAALASRNRVARTYRRAHAN